VLKNLSIKGKLVLLVILPILVLLFLVGKIVVRDISKINNLSKLESVLILSKKLRI